MKKNKTEYSKSPKRVFLYDFIVISLLAVLQIALLLFYVWDISASLKFIEIGFQILSVLVAVYIINKRESATYKLAWIVPILLFPIFGGIMYVFCQGRISIFRFKRRINDVDREILDNMPDCTDIEKDFSHNIPEYASIAHYLRGLGFPVYRNTVSRYFSSGEEMFEELKTALDGAKEYIFIETFIVHEGYMWSTVLDILKEKAAAGVDVRMMYDGVGSLTTLPRRYYKELEKYGIKCKVFNRFVPVISTMQNNRDHRKIISIDGKIAFTGGVNISDEYINRIERFGHWKDAGIMVEGDAAVGYTLMFLRNWNLFIKKPEPSSKYLRAPESGRGTDGWYIPYCDSPFDSELTARNVYLSLIHRAKKKIYIMTPYLILDEELCSAIKLAARSGIDVRIITPHHADKKYVHLMTRSAYAELIGAGVRIYEYEPGFIHSKNILVDDECAVVGSANFDYRSLYLHFECAQLVFSSRSLETLKKDFDDTFDISVEMSLADCRKDSGISRIFSQLLKLFAPLL